MAGHAARLAQHGRAGVPARGGGGHGRRTRPGHRGLRVRVRGHVPGLPGRTSSSGCTTRRWAGSTSSPRYRISTCGADRGCSTRSATGSRRSSRRWRTSGCACRRGARWTRCCSSGSACAYRQVLYRLTGYRYTRLDYSRLPGRATRVGDDLRFALDVIFSVTDAGVRVARMFVVFFAAVAVVAIVVQRPVGDHGRRAAVGAGLRRPGRRSGSAGCSWSWLFSASTRRGSWPRCAAGRSTPWTRPSRGPGRRPRPTASRRRCRPRSASLARGDQRAVHAAAASAAPCRIESGPSERPPAESVDGRPTSGHDARRDGCADVDRPAPARAGPRRAGRQHRTQRPRRRPVGPERRVRRRGGPCRPRSVRAGGGHAVPENVWRSRPSPRPRPAWRST